MQSDNVLVITMIAVVLGIISVTIGHTCRTNERAKQETIRKSLDHGCSVSEVAMGRLIIHCSELKIK